MHRRQSPFRKRRSLCAVFPLPRSTLFSYSRVYFAESRLFLSRSSRLSYRFSALAKGSYPRLYPLPSLLRSRLLLLPSSSLVLSPFPTKSVRVPIVSCTFRFRLVPVIWESLLVSFELQRQLVIIPHADKT